MRAIGRILALLGLAIVATAAQAQQAPYPNKPIRVLIPYGPGGLTDVVARHYADHLRKSLGQNIIVENKPGASGIRAIEEMVHAKPDGYTIMVGNISTNCLTPILLAKRMRINYDRDVQIIARTADAAQASLGVRRGLETGNLVAAAIGVEPDWAVRVVRAVGNYGEMFERNLGRGSPLGLERGANRLWNQGGLMYAPPMR